MHRTRLYRIGHGSCGNRGSAATGRYDRAVTATTPPRRPLAFGITAAQRDAHGRLGAELQRLGYDEAWSNDTRRGDGLATLAAVARGAPGLALGVGVVALSEHDPRRIAERVMTSGIALDRFTLGVGSGSSASLALVRDGVGALRHLLPSVPIAVAAVGPRMLHLAGEVADAVVATWSLPERVAEIRDHVAAGAQVAGRPPPRIVLYVRVSAGPGAESRLRTEMDRYAAYGRHYARAFASQLGGLIGLAVESGDRDEMEAALMAYRSVADTVVVRALPRDDTINAWLEIAELAAPRGGGG